MCQPKVQVLLSTFNGQKYLDRLLESVFRQDYPNLGLFVRDDGSTDGTLGVLEQYRGLKNLQICPGENLGAVGSFFRLVEISSPEAAYIAFCDQDDVWKADKVSRAVGMLEQYGSHRPVMYCSRVTLVDESLKTLGYTQRPRRRPDFRNALLENIATGCTIVLNDAARQLFLGKAPNKALIHDWWIYQVVSAFGEVVYDPESRLLYRQHAGNVIGEKSSLLARWRKRLRRFFKLGRLTSVSVQAREFSKIYGDILPQDKKIILDRFLNERNTLWGRLRYAFRGETYRQGRLDNLIFRLLVVLNRI